jgi:hypothetical protein
VQHISALCLVKKSKLKIIIVIGKEALFEPQPSLEDSA